jgi:hypothetical protein
VITFTNFSLQQFCQITCQSWLSISKQMYVCDTYEIRFAHIVSFACTIYMISKLHMKVHSLNNILINMYRLCCIFVYYSCYWQFQWIDKLDYVLYILKTSLGYLDLKREIINLDVFESLESKLSCSGGLLFRFLFGLDLFFKFILALCVLLIEPRHAVKLWFSEAMSTDMLLNRKRKSAVLTFSHRFCRICNCNSQRVTSHQNCLFFFRLKFEIVLQTTI